jgi:Domain of unknown function (DUF4326)
MPIRFQPQRSLGYRKPPSSKVVSRASRFGNPFRVPAALRSDPSAHKNAVERYRRWIMAPEQAELLAAARRKLQGRDLGCHCHPYLACHADVLLELVNCA